MHNVQGRRRGSLDVRRPLIWLGATAALAVILDQSTKHIITASLGSNEVRTIIPRFFDVVRVENTGAAFGMLPGQQSLFIGISLLMLIGVAVYWRRERPSAWPVVIALGLVVGGAVGNLIDRVFIGRVTDFLAFSVFSPVFNIADSAIVTGVVVLVLWTFFGPRPEAEGEGEGDALPAQPDASR